MGKLVYWMDELGRTGADATRSGVVLPLSYVCRPQGARPLIEQVYFFSKPGGK